MPVDMKKYIQIFIITSLLYFTSCESIVDDLNTDPNNPTSASASLMLTGVQLSNMSVHEGHTARLAGMWSGYFIGIARQYPDFSNYNATGSTFDQIWQNIYAGVVKNGNILISKVEAIDNRLVIGITKITQAHSLSIATSCWGDIPFTETADIDAYPNPAFDPQLEVYEGVQIMLDDAITLLESGIGSSPEEADIHFGGDATPWMEVAYTLKARSYLEVHDYQAAYEMAKMGVSTQENSLMGPHGSVRGSNENLMYDFIAGGRAGDMNSQNTYLARVLKPDEPEYKGNAKTDESARFHFYYLNTDDLGAIIPNTTTNGGLKGIFAQDASFPLVTYQENLLILAEAGTRAMGFDEGLKRLNDYRSYMGQGGYLDPTYTDGTFALQYAPYTTEDFAPGGIVNTTGLTPTEALLKEILLERYVTFFGQKQGFSDIRRTRHEAVGVKPPPNVGSDLPERFIYSQSEINSNTSAPDPVPDLFVPTPVNQIQ